MKSILIALIILFFVGIGRASTVEIIWDKDLAFDYDRKNYAQRLQNIVENSLKTVLSSIQVKMRRSLKVRVYAPKAYAKTFGSAAAGSQGAHYYRGAIHVNGGNRLGDRFFGLMLHEITHAVLDYKKTAGRLPRWLNEGVAERFRWHHLRLTKLTTGQIAELKRALDSGKLTPLVKRGSLLPFGYLQSFAAVMFLEEKYGSKALGKILSETLDGKPFEKNLQKATFQSIRSFEKKFSDWVSDLP
jgi:hypothetical protein